MYLKRFKSKIDFGKCWEWQSQTDDDGYGIFSVGGKKHRAHRVAYYLEHGELPEVVRHSCDNPSCVNPDHLQGGTQADNIRDRQARDRQARGSQNGRSKLDEDTVLICRRRHSDGASIRGLAREYDVDRKTMGAAIKGETWSHVRMPAS